MEVEKIKFTPVKCSTHIFVGLIRRTKFYRPCAGKCPIDGVAGGGSGKNAYFERIAFGMLCFCPLGNLYRHHLRAAGMGKTTEAYVVIIFHKRRSLFSTDKF